MKDERLEKLADVLVNYSTKVKKGDRVAISAEDAALPFIKAVARAAVKAGALVEYYIDVPDVDAELLKRDRGAICQRKYSFWCLRKKRCLDQRMG